MEPLARIARFLEAQGAAPGIQLAHAGRKASCAVPWQGGASLKTTAEGGWPIVGPSPLPFSEGDPLPRELDERGIGSYIEALGSGWSARFGSGLQGD
jgi:2,4-dienoyl-CoA reductase-like NADH-dependent reductase (Old Yellow Enzyme family)